MNNIKTGTFIRERRKELGLTQKELAERLHITDRAVSKWERGLSAPDIGVLESLAEALDVSVVEILEGAQDETVRQSGEEERNRRVIRYSGEEVARKVKHVRKASFTILLTCLAVALFGIFILCRSGRWFVIDQIPSPDGTARATVYRKALEGGGFSMEDATSLILKKGEEDGVWRINYGDCTYQGLWWAPDGRKYVLALDYGDESYLALAWLDRNSESNLNAYLSMGVEATELRKCGYAAGAGAFPNIEYQFLQWGLNSTSMLIYYSFEDAEDTLHDGYFWYDCEKGEVNAILEMDFQA